MHIVFHLNAFRFKQNSLLAPSRHKTTGMIYYAMARIVAVVLRHSEHFSDETRIFFTTDEPRNLSVSGDTSFRNFFYDREYFINQVFA